MGDLKVVLTPFPWERYAYNTKQVFTTNNLPNNVIETFAYRQRYNGHMPEIEPTATFFQDSRGSDQIFEDYAE